MTPTYAVVGASGNTGTAIIKSTLSRSLDAQIHAYCRNSAKLRRLLPEETQSPRLTIFEGSITDVSRLSSCVENTAAVFLAACTNENIPGCSIAQDSAAAVLSALKDLRSSNNKNFRAPKIIVLSAAALHPKLLEEIPAAGRFLLLRACAFQYEDHRVQERLLRAESDWLASVYVKPGAISYEEPSGSRLSFDEGSQVVSYADLGSAMVDAAEEGTGMYDGKDLAVVSVKGDGKLPWVNVGMLILGLVSYYAPWAHKWLPKLG